MKDEKERNFIREFRDLVPDYLPSEDGILNEEEPRLARVKEIIFRELDLVDRVLILMYADCQSLRLLGMKLGVSKMTISKEIRRIRAEILARMEKKK